MVIISLENENISADEFYELIQAADQSELNKISNLMVRRMTFYLVTVMNANRETAKDCAQQAFENVYAKIMEGSLLNVKDIFGYLIRSAKNEYLMVLRKDKVEVPNEYSYFSRVVGDSGKDVVDSLYSEEQERLLKYCIEKLKSKKKKFFLSVLKHINRPDKETADKLNMSYGNFRTKKSRVIDALRECVKNAVT